MATEMARRCEVRAAGLNLPIGSLSRRQPAEGAARPAARHLAAGPGLRRPDRGVDVHGRESIYALVSDWCAEGNAVV